MYLGGALLCLAPALYYPHMRDLSTGEPSEYRSIIDIMIALFGFAFAGPLYFAWIIWRRERFTALFRIVGMDG